MTSSSAPTDHRPIPERINLTVFDRGFLIPETDDPHGPYFPMSRAAVIPLIAAPNADAMVNALMAVNDKYPQLRLGYTLDVQYLRWNRVPTAELKTYFARLVKVCDPQPDITNRVGELISRNPLPFAYPIQFFIDGNQLIFYINHVLGDGRYLARIISYVLTALFDPQGFDKLPLLPMNFSLPAWRLMFQTSRQGVQVLVGWLASFKSTFDEFQQDMSAEEAVQTLTPIVCGSEMGVSFKLIAPEVMNQLNTLRKNLSPDGIKITLNTLVQVLISQRLQELGLFKWRPVYTIPVDLHRYLKAPDEFYPSNLVGQIRVMSNSRALSDLKSECLELQQKANEKLNGLGPILSLPSECLLALNDKAYKRINRSWLTTSINTDKRFFILTNIGPLDQILGVAAKYIDMEKGIVWATPLMGGPHLVCNFSSLAAQGNLTITYDPRVLSAEQIEQIIALFSPDWLGTKA